MTLRKFITLSFISVLCLTNSYGQGKADKTSTLAKIRQAFQQINEYKNYRIVTIDDAEEFLGHGTDNGGSLKGYYKGDSLKKIVEWAGLSNRVVQIEYYFDKGKLVFVYSTDKQYKFNEKTEEFDYSKFDKVITGRYYFSNDKLIETIISDKEHQKTKQQDVADFLSSSKDYIKLLNARRK
jgi:tRNA-dihydrouridine synthase